jgi:hypothetical protein
MVALATYMGITATYGYLEATADVMRDVLRPAKGFCPRERDHDAHRSPHGRGRRNGLMGFSLIGGSCLEVEVPNTSILKTEHPGCHLISQTQPLLEQDLARSALPR